jgi:hypothetical protein
MKEKPAEKSEPRKPYVKPEVKQVPLRPEEAVLGFCKHASGAAAGPSGSTCSSPSQCYGFGS